MDTGLNMPESLETLLLQQKQLTEGKRLAQMFPIGTKELRLPKGFERVKMPRGIFHFNPKELSKKDIEKISWAERENEILGLGPYNKIEVVRRILNGETPVVVVEIFEGIEVRAAIGTTATAQKQLEVFRQTKLEGSTVKLENALEVLLRRVGAHNG